MKKLDALEFCFRIPPSGVNAIATGTHFHFSPGLHLISDPATARFLQKYPNVTLVAVRPLNPPGPIKDDDPRQFDRLPEEGRVVSGFSGGCFGTQKFLKPAVRSKGR